MKQNILTHENYVKLIRLWLTGMLIFLPFQLWISNNIVLNTKMSSFTRFTDEITIIIFLPLAIIEFIRNKEIRDWLYLMLLFPLFGLFACGFISGILNNNPLMITIAGTLDYIRNCFVIFIYAAFFREFSDFKKIFQFLLIVAVFIGVIALTQELWAMISHYSFKEDSHSKIYLLLKNIMRSEYPSRLGFYRVDGLMGHFIYLGLYCLLILSIYMYTVEKVRFPVFLALYSGIIFSVSRMVYIGFTIISGVQIFRTKKKRMLVVLALIPIVIIMFKLSTLWDFNLSRSITMSQQDGSESLLSDPDLNYRKYSRDTAMHIWGDHPFWGVGPGIFGGIISVKYESYIYEEYNFAAGAKSLLNRWKHIDQFWPQILAEIGIIGTANFAALLVSLFAVLFIAQNRTVLDEMKGLFAGCVTFLIVVLIYSLGNIINITPVIFPFFALIGMGLGCQKANREEMEKCY